MNLPTGPIKTWLLGALLVVMTVAVYLPTRTFDFINFDDPDYVSANPRVQAGWTGETIRWAFTEAHSSNWHPVTWLTHALDCQLFGVNPGAHHLVNVAFHAANTLLLLLLLHRLTGQLGRSAMVAGLFALHPLHVESVAWIAERKDVLSTFFGLLTLMAYARYAVGAPGQRPANPVSQNRDSELQAARRQPSCSPFPGRALWYVLALGFFALGLMSKPMLVTWPCVMLLLDVWPLRRVPMAEFRASSFKALVSFVMRHSSLLWEKLPFVALTVASSLITMIVQRGAGAAVPLDVLPLSARLAHIPVAYLRYLGKTFWPENLAVFYPYELIAWDHGLLWLALVLLTVVSGWAIRELRARPFLAVGWFWFLGTLVPVIGLVQVGRQAMADRYSYVPLIGLFVALVWLVADWLERRSWPRAVQIGLSVTLLGVCLGLTSRQVRHWQNTGTLAAHTARVTTGNYMALTQLAGALTEAGKFEEALSEIQKALAIKPDFAEAHNSRAAILLRQGRLEAARAAYLEAARCDVTFPDPHHGLAELELRQNQPVAAEAHAREALRIAPMHLGAHFALAQALHQQGKLEEAVAAYQKLLLLKPDLYAGQRGLGSVFMLQGKFTEAAAAFEAAVKLQPALPDGRNALGMALLAQGQKPAASNQFSQALTQDPTNGIANYQIALLLDASGQFAAAARHYRAALQAQPDAPEVLNNLAWLLASAPDASVRAGAEAVRYAERACELTGRREPMLLGTLAAAYAQAGRFEDAVKTAEEAITVARAAGLAGVVAANEKLLNQYRAGKTAAAGRDEN